MKITFEGEDRLYKADNLEDIESIYYAIQDGINAMGYHKNTAKDLVQELKNDEDD